MKFLFISILLIPSMSFAQNKKMLKGSYQEIPIIVVSSKSVEVVWSSVIDFFSANGIGVKTIDRSSGIIVGYSPKLIPHTCYERNESPESKTSWIVVKKVKGLNTANVSSDFNIRVREEAGQTQISISLFNIIVESDKPESAKWKYMDCSSTGVFERSLSELIK